ncbi:MAG: DUF1836 domain-containing protein [Saccharofermentanales bacterium]
MKENKSDGVRNDAENHADAASQPDVRNDTAKKKILEWNRRFSAYKPAAWDRLPDIELYMDQVVTLLDRQLVTFRNTDEDKMITSSMINNYTKDRVIPRAESKKYSREHIALLLIVCSMKKVMSMPDLSTMLRDFRLNTDDDIEKFYDLFGDVQIKGIEKTSHIVAEALKEAPDEPEDVLLRNIALQLAVEAQMQCIAAEQILSLLKIENER